MTHTLQFIWRMFRSLLLPITLFQFNTTCYAQPDSILALKGDPHVGKLWDWYYSQQQLDSTVLFAQLDILESAYLKKKERELARQVWYLKVYHQGTYLYASNTKSIDIFHQAIEKAKENDWPFILGMLHTSLGLTHAENKRWGPAFENLLKGDAIRLREIMPDLTPADTRLLALTRLNLTSKEMGSILGISADSIKKSRQRLRRRLNLPEEGSLDELIEGL